MNSSTIFIEIPSGSATNETSDGPPLPGPPYSAEQIALFTMLSVFFVLGVVGNALAFYIYYQKRDKTTSTLFILSLAATDFLTCLVGIPYTLVTEMLKYWLRYDLVCKGYLFVMTFNVPLSAFIMVAVGFDRYFCICHPFLHAMTVRRAKVCLVCLTLLACVLGIITALGYGVYYSDQDTDTDVADVTAVTSLSSSSSLSPSLSSAVDTPATVKTILAAGGQDQGQGDMLEPVYSVINATSHHHRPSRSSGGSLLLESAAVAAATSFSQITPPYTSLSPSDAPPLLTPSAVDKYNNNQSVTYIGMCVPNQLIFSLHFSNVYQKVYAATFLFSFLIIALLYALIYRSILVRRAWKAKRKRMSCYASTVNGPEAGAGTGAGAGAGAGTEETQLTNINNGNSVNSDPSSGRITSRTSVALRDRMLYANIKTAAMLFVVTVVFIISFLPSWLIGLAVIPMNLILFYIFFLNNVANPFIYAFMNRTFRDDLRQLLKRIKLRLSGW